MVKSENHREIGICENQLRILVKVTTDLGFPGAAQIHTYCPSVITNSIPCL